MLKIISSFILPAYAPSLLLDFGRMQGRSTGFQANLCLTFLRSSPLPFCLGIIFDLLDKLLGVTTILLFLKVVSVGPQLSGSISGFHALAGVVVATFLTKTLVQSSVAILRRDALLMLQRDLLALHPTIIPRLQIGQIGGRDFPRLLEATADVFSVFSIPLALGFIISAVGYWQGWQSLLLLLSLLALLPISLLLTRISHQAYRRVMKIEGHRFRLVTAWMEKGATLKHWGIGSLLQKINYTIREEIKARNFDSYVRSLNSYLTAFGRVLPIFLILYFDTLKPLEFLWLALPITLLIMDFPRAFTGYSSGNQALRSILRLRLLLNARSEIEPLAGLIHVSDDWPIWSGTWRENLILHPSFDDLGMKILSFLNLDFALHQTIEHAGNNLSAGERTRLRIARGMILAITFKRKMRLDLSLNSLDVENRKHLQSLIGQDVVCAVLEQMLANTIATPISRDRSIANASLLRSVNAQVQISWTKIISKIWPYLLGFGLSAYLLSHITQQAAGSEFLQEIPLIGLLALLGLAVGSGTGFFLEKSVRQLAGSWLTEILNNVRDEGMKTDKIQALNHDFMMMCERIAWYLHDIFWILGMLFSLLVLSAATNPLHLLPAFVFLVLLFCGLWRIFIPRISAWRAQLVKANNILFDLCLDIHAMTQMLVIPDDWRRLRIAQDCTEFFQAHFALHRYRAAFSNYVFLVMSGMSIAFLSILQQSNTKEAMVVGFLSAYFLLESEISRLFFALSGLRTNWIAVERLHNYTQVHVEAVPVVKAAGQITIPAFKNCYSYRAINLQDGELLQLCGPSGSGKTQYLKAIAGLIGNHQISNLRIFYFDRRIQQYFRSMASPPHLLEILGGHTADILILDEVFSTLDVMQAKMLLQSLAQQSHIRHIIFVDHRFEAGRQVAIDTLIEGRVNG